jgi:hypothetical protein
MEVTLQMLQGSTPTIPFVLSLYLHMKKHLTNVSKNTSLPFPIQAAGDSGLEKL